jgi:hypothetical protein
MRTPPPVQMRRWAPVEVEVDACDLLRVASSSLSFSAPYVRGHSCRSSRSTIVSVVPTWRLELCTANSTPCPSDPAYPKGSQFITGSNKGRDGLLRKALQVRAGNKVILNWICVVFVFGCGCDCQSMFVVWIRLKIKCVREQWSLPFLKMRMRMRQNLL